MIKKDLPQYDKINGVECPFLMAFLDRFYMSRIGIRFLISQHCARHHPQPGYSGIVSLRMDPVEVAQQVSE